MVGPGPDSQCPPPGAGRRPRLDPADLAARDALMLDLHERGWSTRRIAAELGVTQPAVVKALVRARVVEADRLDP